MMVQDAKAAGFVDPNAAEFKHFWGVLACSVHVCTGFPVGDDPKAYGFDAFEKQLKELKPGEAYAKAKAMIGVLASHQKGAMKLLEKYGWKCLGKQLSSHNDNTWVYLYGFNFLPANAEEKPRV